jgi:hypothetical protein
VAAARFSETLQLSVPAPVIDPLAQVKPLNPGKPAPLMGIADTGLVEELLVMVSVLLTGPATIGLNSTLRIAVWVGVRISGKVTPETEKPVPVTLAALTVTGAVPVEDNVRNCVAGEFTLPKAMPAALTLSLATDAAASCRPKDFATLLALAVKVAA